MVWWVSNEDLKEIMEKAQVAWHRETDSKLQEHYGALLVGATDALIRQLELELKEKENEEARGFKQE